jgi:hypothetical protein
MAKRRRPTPHPVPAEPAAGNELLDRRLFLTQSIALLGAGSLAAGALTPTSAAEPPDSPPWMHTPGAPLSGYGSPAKNESTVTRTNLQSQPGTTGWSGARARLPARAPCAPLAATGPTPPRCSTMSAGRCRTRSHNR